MAKTLLNGVNEVLQRVGLIQGDSGTLATLTNSGRQVYIDLAVQVWNEAVENLYRNCELPMPNELAENTVTLVAATRAYTLASDLVQLHFPLLDETNGTLIDHYPGGYMKLVADQIQPDSHTGIPNYAVIRPTDGKLYIDTSPSTEVAGRVYKYRYDKDISLSAAADTFPFSDAVFRAMVPAVAELWTQRRRNKFTEGIYRQSIGRASELLTMVQPRGSWLRRAGGQNVTDPFSA